MLIGLCAPGSVMQPTCMWASPVPPADHTIYLLNITNNKSTDLQLWLDLWGNKQVYRWVFCGWMKTSWKVESKEKVLSSLTVTSWHVRIRERISPQIEVPIFHQPSTGCKCWGKLTHSLLLAAAALSRLHLSHTLLFSVKKPDCSSASHTRWDFINR